MQLHELATVVPPMFAGLRLEDGQKSSKFDPATLNRKGSKAFPNHSQSRALNRIWATRFVISQERDILPVNFLCSACEAVRVLSTIASLPAVFSEIFDALLLRTIAKSTPRLLTAVQPL